MTQQFHSQVSTQEKWKHMSTQKLVYQMFMVALLIVVKKAKTTQMSIKWWNNNKASHIYTREYYSIIKNEISTHATTWMNLKNILLSERNHM